MRRSAIATLALVLATAANVSAQRPNKPVLHGQHWVAITGKPLAATAGARIFQEGGNAVDAACAMLGSVTTMWDVLSWGGETQALIYNPNTGKVIGINALGVAPTGATAEFYRSKGYDYPPEYGPLAAVTPGTPGGLMTMLAEYGTMSLAQVLAPAIELADGYPIEAQTANSIERAKDQIKEWPYSKAVFLPHLGDAAREAPSAGEIFRQKDLAATLRKLVAAEKGALDAGKSRKEAIYAAYDRFYKGDIAQEIVRSVREQGGLFTMDDLAKWQVHIEEPVHTSYKGIEVYKLTHWVQGPVMLQTLNILENFDLKSMGYNSARYMHTLYQAMNLAYADRDFYYGDPYLPPEEPIEGLLSKDYARERAKLIDPDRNDPDVRPGDPYPFMGKTNPYTELLAGWHTTTRFGDHGKPTTTAAARAGSAAGAAADAAAGDEFGAAANAAAGDEFGAAANAAAGDEFGAAADAAAGDEFGAAADGFAPPGFFAGTTSIQTADDDGWVVSVTPSGGWVPAVIAGHTGVGLSQRAQSFVLYEAEDPFNVIQPGQRPRATLTPGLAMKDGKPYLSFAVQGGDTQDQNLLQFFLDVVEFGMDVQEATEAANINSYQMRSSFGTHESEPGRVTVQAQTSPWVLDQMRHMGYRLDLQERTSGPINAIFFDREHGTFWGGSSDYGEDYGIAW